MNQDNPGSNVQVGIVYARKGRHDEAIVAITNGVKLGDNSPDTQILLGCAYAQAGKREEAQVILRRLEARREYVSPGALASLYISLGEREHALASLERAYAEHDNQLQFLTITPEFDALRSESRFQALLRK